MRALRPHAAAAPFPELGLDGGHAHGEEGKELEQQGRHRRAAQEAWVASGAVSLWHWRRTYINQANGRTALQMQMSLNTNPELPITSRQQQGCTR